MRAQNGGQQTCFRPENGLISHRFKMRWPIPHKTKKPLLKNFITATAGPDADAPNVGLVHGGVCALV